MIKKEILRLGSVVKHGVGGIGAGHIDIIYSYLLLQHKLDFYDYIHVNQVNDELEEFVMKDGRKIYVNIRYPAYENFERRTEIERAYIRVDVVHQALLMIAKKDERFSEEIINKIRTDIIEHNYSYDFVLHEWISNYDKDLSVKLVVNPRENQFDFYAVIYYAAQQKCKTHLYDGKCTSFYFNDLFNRGKWINKDEFVLSGSAKQVNIHILANECKVKFVNLTEGEYSPLFEMMRANSKINANVLYGEWMNSLPAATAAIIRDATN
jgi:hypothetical protein